MISSGKVVPVAKRGKAIFWLFVSFIPAYLVLEAGPGHSETPPLQKKSVQIEVAGPLQAADGVKITDARGSSAAEHGVQLQADGCGELSFGVSVFCESFRDIFSEDAGDEPAAKGEEVCSDEVEDVHTVKIPFWQWLAATWLFGFLLGRNL